MIGDMLFSVVKLAEAGTGRKSDSSKWQKRSSGKQSCMPAYYWHTSGCY